MDDSRQRELKLGALRLPELKLLSSRGSPVPLRPPGRVSPVLVMVDGPECAACRDYLRRLAESSSEVEEWDGRVIAVVPASPDQAARFAGDAAAPFTTLADPDRSLAGRLALLPPAVVVADQYGVAHHAFSGEADHHLPDPAEIVSWLRYLAVQCPECQGEAL